jgi:Cft2 family RNA processing exonuclease
MASVFNAQTTAGVVQAPSPTGALKCGDVGTYRDMKKRKTNKQERDHVPATSSMLQAAENKGVFKGLDGDERNCVAREIKMSALTIAIPKGVHVKYSRTCKGRGGQARVDKDAGNLDQAAKDDIADLENQVPEGCKAAYKQAAEQVKAQDHEGLFAKAKAKCTS